MADTELHEVTDKTTRILAEQSQIHPFFLFDRAMDNL
jgi:hypothetical protein